MNARQWRRFWRKVRTGHPVHVRSAEGRAVSAESRAAAVAALRAHQQERA